MHNPGGAIVGAIVNLIVQCNCGHPSPIFINWNTNVITKSTCPTCKTEFFLGLIDFDYQRDAGAQPRLGLGFLPPKVITPPSGLLVPRTM